MRVVYECTYLCIQWETLAMAEMAEINEISCEVQRRRWNWLGHELRREGVTVLWYQGGHQKMEGQEGDQRPLEEGLSKERERERQGRVEELECGQDGGV